MDGCSEPRCSPANGEDTTETIPKSKDGSDLARATSHYLSDSNQQFGNSYQNCSRSIEPLFKHTPLEDATNQLRLLEFQPDAKDSRIICNIEKWDIDSAPPYAAISYVWGDYVPTSHIILNDRCFGVTSNCHYALQQVLAQQMSSSAKYYWIDSICIDQESNTEKGAQVRRMGDIFQGAVEVLACVGAHEDDSELLCDILHHCTRNKDEVRTSTRATAVLVNTCAKLWRSYAGAHSMEDCFRKFFVALSAFDHQPYWRRLWIVQEILMARSLFFLCGDSKFGISPLLNCLHCHLKSGNESEWTYRLILDEAKNPSFSSVYMRKVLTITGHRSPWQEPGYSMSNASDVDYVRATFELFANFECSQWRDRLYAMLRVVLWPKDCDVRSIKPDYTISEYGLLRQLAVCLAPGLIRESLRGEEWYAEFVWSAIIGLGEALKLSTSTPEMISLREKAETSKKERTDIAAYLRLTEADLTRQSNMEEAD